MVGASELVLVVFLVILLTGTALFGNGCVFVAFCRNKHIRTANNYFFLTLSFANAMVGLCYPLQCLVDVGILKYRSVCLPITCVLLFVALIVTWIIVALTVERYLNIIQPFAVQQILTEKRILGIVILIVSYAMVGGAVVPAALSAKVNPAGPAMDANDTAVLWSECRLSNLVPSRAYRYFYFANRVVSIPIFMAIYLRIFLVARRHTRAIAVQVVQPTTRATPNHSGNPSSVRRYEQHPKARWRREIRLTLLLFTIAFYQSLCWIPQTVLLLQNRALPSILYTLTHFFTYSSSAVYPVIYGLGNREFREALTNLFGCWNKLDSLGAGSRLEGISLGEEGRSRRTACTTIAESGLSGTVQSSDQEASSPTAGDGN